MKIVHIIIVTYTLTIELHSHMHLLHLANNNIFVIEIKSPKHFIWFHYHCLAKKLNNVIFDVYVKGSRFTAVTLVSHSQVSVKFWSVRHFIKILWWKINKFAWNINLLFKKISATNRKSLRINSKWVKYSKKMLVVLIIKKNHFLTPDNIFFKKFDSKLLLN